MAWAMVGSMEASPANVVSEGPLDSTTPQNSTKGMTVKLCGDRQLWTIQGTTIDEEPWAIPIYADPFQGGGERYWRIEPAISVTASMWNALEGRVKPYRVNVAADSCILAEESLKAIGCKCDGITPGYYLQWGAEHAASPKVDSERVDSKDPGGPEAERFLHYLVQRTGVSTLPHLKVIWRAICQEGLIWMAEEHKPLHLGFVRLVPLPYRRNWKEVAFALHPRAVVHINQLKNNRPKMEDQLDRCGFTADLVNSMLTALDRKIPHIHWTIEVAPQPAWLQASEEVERKRCLHTPPTKYTEYVRQNIARRIPEILQILVQYVRDTLLPAGSVDSGRTWGSPVLIPWRPPGAIAPRPAPTGPVRVVADSGTKELKGPVTADLVSSAVEVMPEVPHLQPQTPDLWRPPDGEVHGPNGTS